ncbi:MAG: hypothetical protein HFH91_14875, partial [Lachnospiraceae bacterium]|nr:hypothetical protein [Lachnospiraceae bacterium]
SVGDEDRDGGESNSIQNQKKFLESYARQLKLTNSILLQEQREQQPHRKQDMERYKTGRRDSQGILPPPCFKP